VMTRACVQRARTAVIDGRDDNETLAIAVAVDHAHPGIHLVAAVRDLGRRESLRYVNADVQVVQWHMPFLLSEEAGDPGITQVYNDLMSSGGHGNTYSMRVPAGFPHATFGDCQVHFGRTFGATVLAVRGAEGLVVSPPWQTPVPPGRRSTTWPGSGSPTTPGRGEGPRFRRGVRGSRRSRPLPRPPPPEGAAPGRRWSGRAPRPSVV
jgi:voltage-gated potassium channel